MTGPALTESRCQCTACGEYFNSTSIFDLHRVGPFAPLRQTACERRCLTPEEMAARGYLRSAAGFWVKRLREACTARVEAPPDPYPATTLPARAEGPPKAGLD
jgi:hypothetical protein